MTKTLRTELESRIQTQCSSQLDLLASLPPLVPIVVSSIDLSLQVVSSFNSKPLTPTPSLPNVATTTANNIPSIKIRYVQHSTALGGYKKYIFYYQDSERQRRP
ncbi:unnamed protein product [Linum trigynum]|uniref:Uncharacterized protein n=1 Tax=Linum trigynum TaxID=586398 RepID=A0AAV2DS05_9ROSI